MSIEDISAAKVLGEEKAEAGSLWSDVWVYDGGSTEGQGARKGGGGMFRAFVSHHAPTHRLENGKTDFKSICSAWREEKQKPEESEVMRECRARGTAATLAHKMNVQPDGKKLVTSVSSFGKVYVKALKSEEAKVKRQTELDDFKRSLASTRDDQHALCLRDARHTFSQQLVAKHSGDLHGQVAAIYRVARLLAAERREADAAERDRVKAKLRQEH